MAPEQSTVRLPLLSLTGRSGKGSLHLPLMLQGGDHTGLQTAFGNLQVTVQAIDQIDQQLLFYQLSLTNGTPQNRQTVLIVNTQVTAATVIGRSKLGLVRGQGIVEQSADSFHPDHSLARVRKLTIGAGGKFARPVITSIRDQHDSFDAPPTLCLPKVRLQAPERLLQAHH